MSQQPTTDTLADIIRGYVAKKNINSGKKEIYWDTVDVYRLVDSVTEGGCFKLDVNDTFLKDNGTIVGIIVLNSPYIIKRRDCMACQQVKGIMYIKKSDLTSVPYTVLPKIDNNLLLFQNENRELKEENTRIKGEIIRLEDELANSTIDIERMKGEILVLREEANALANEQVALLESQITTLREELIEYQQNKRKRGDTKEVLENDREQSQEQSSNEKVCVVCQKTLPLSSFTAKISRKNKEEKNVIYVVVRNVCNTCRSQKHRKTKKTKLSK